MIGPQLLTFIVVEGKVRLGSLMVNVVIVSASYFKVSYAFGRPFNFFMMFGKTDFRLI